MPGIFEREPILRNDKKGKYINIFKQLVLDIT